MKWNPLYVGLEFELNNRKFIVGIDNDSKLLNLVANSDLKFLLVNED